ncbi:MAG: alpha/beta hydrolase [Proteobacteria bacterium]|nr:alpha/beta hydrolase [Pseudomonadota bacterium]
MPVFKNNETEIYYEEHGEGFPLLLLAPGGMRSSLEMWETQPWNPVASLADHFRVIAMDQRNAGRSTAPVLPTDSWQVYTADQLALLDHLGVNRFSVLGMCIGGSFGMGLIEAAPERVASAVLFQPIGLDETGPENNRGVFFEMFDDWAKEIAGKQPAVTEKTWQVFRHAMYGGDFLFNVARDFVAACTTPLLVFCGHDIYHPESISREVADITCNAEFVEFWKEAEYLESTSARVASFLASNSR